MRSAVEHGEHSERRREVAVHPLQQPGERRDRAGGCAACSTEPLSRRELQDRDPAPPMMRIGNAGLDGDDGARVATEPRRRAPRDRRRGDRAARACRRPRPPSGRPGDAPAPVIEERRQPFGEQLVDHTRGTGRRPAGPHRSGAHRARGAPETLEERRVHLDATARPRVDARAPRRLRPRTLPTPTADRAPSSAHVETRARLRRRWNAAIEPAADDWAGEAAASEAASPMRSSQAGHGAASIGAGARIGDRQEHGSPIQTIPRETTNKRRLIARGERLVPGATCGARDGLEDRRGRCGWRDTRRSIGQSSPRARRYAAIGVRNGISEEVE